MNYKPYAKLILSMFTGLRVRKLPLARDAPDASEDSDSGNKKKKNAVNNNNNQGNGLYCVLSKTGLLLPGVALILFHFAF